MAVRAASNLMVAFEVIEVRDNGDGANNGPPSTSRGAFSTIASGEFLWWNGVISTLTDPYRQFLAPQPDEIVTVMRASSGGTVANCADVTKQDVKEIWCNLGFNLACTLSNGRQAPKIGWAAVPDKRLNKRSPSTWRSLLPHNLKANTQAPAQSVGQPLVGSLAIAIALAVCTGPGGHHQACLRGFKRDQSGLRCWDQSRQYDRPCKLVTVRLYSSSNCNQARLELSFGFTLSLLGRIAPAAH